MRKEILVIIAFACILQAGYSQPKIDTLQADQLREISVIAEIYNLPHSRYILDHFVFVHKSTNIDPHVQYNKGGELSEEAKLFLRGVKPGDTIIVKEVYAHNSEAPGIGPIKMPERMFLVK